MSFPAGGLGKWEKQLNLPEEHFFKFPTVKLSILFCIFWLPTLSFQGCNLCIRNFILNTNLTIWLGCTSISLNVIITLFCYNCKIISLLFFQTSGAAYLNCSILLFFAGGEKKKGDFGWLSGIFPIFLISERDYIPKKIPI